MKKILYSIFALIAIYFIGTLLIQDIDRPIDDKVSDDRILREYQIIGDVRSKTENGIELRILKSAAENLSGLIFIAKNECPDLTLGSVYSIKLTLDMDGKYSCVSVTEAILD